MTQAIIALLPEESGFVPSCLENLLDKKISGVALNRLERFVDWFCSWFYCPYHALYNAKMARVHIFSDEAVRLFDATKQKIAKIHYELDQDFISVNDRSVYFSPNPNIEMTFSRQAHIDYVLVKDDEKRRPGWFQIVTQEISRPGNRKPMEIMWELNTNKLPIKRRELAAYLVEQPIPAAGI